MQSLLKQLEDLGDQIVAADLPRDVRKILGGLVHFVETGSLEPPAPPVNTAAAQQINEDQAEIARLQDQVAQLTAAQAGSKAAPEPIAPEAPTPPVPPAGAVLPLPPAPAEPPAPEPPAVSG